jgi:hypothetical protein
VHDGSGRHALALLISELHFETKESGRGLDDLHRRLPGASPCGASTGIGSDTQKPFAIVIAAGLVSRFFLGFFVNPVLYEMVARDGDVLQI